MLHVRGEKVLRAQGARSGADRDRHLHLPLVVHGHGHGVPRHVSDRPRDWRDREHGEDDGPASGYGADPRRRNTSAPSRW